MYPALHEPALNRCRPAPTSLALCCVLTLLWAAGGRADLLREGEEAVRRGRPEQAYELFSRAAQAGDPRGEYGLGVLYLHGTGVAQDLSLATHWFRVAAGRDYPPALLNLGNAYLYGRGVPRDLAKVGRWWRRAARLGYAPAQFNLGVLLSGEGAAAGLREEGIAWIRLAARQGLSKAGDRLEVLGESLEFPRLWTPPEREPWRSEGRLMTLDPEGYTIQVLTARRAATAQRFVALNGLDGQALVFRFPYQGELWHGLVIGQYRDVEQARQAAATLPSALRDVELWYRPLYEVQRQILAVRRAEGKNANRPGAGG